MYINLRLFCLFVRGHIPRYRGRILITTVDHIHIVLAPFVHLCLGSAYMLCTVYLKKLKLISSHSHPFHLNLKSKDGVVACS